VRLMLGHHGPVSDWDMHSDPGSTVPEDQELPEGTRITGEVICHHAFGMGVRLDGPVQYGHVNITEISQGPLRGPEDFPPIGSHVSVVVIGYTGIGGQLRLSATR